MAQSPATKPTAAVGHSKCPALFHRSMTSPFTLTAGTLHRPAERPW